MLIEKICPFTGKVNTKEIDVTLLQLKAWQHGQLIQKAMPNVSPSDREFIMTGITDDAWDDMFDDEG
jgi:hypothetical protein